MWATNQLYLCAGVRVQVRSTSHSLAQHVDRFLGRFTLTGEDPATSDICYSFVAGAEPTHRGQRSFHFVYKEIEKLARSTSPAELLTMFANDLTRTLPAFEENLYAIQAGAVMCGKEAILLVGDQLEDTRRLVATFCARGFTYTTCGPIYIDPRDNSWLTYPQPLICSDTATIAAVMTSGATALPSGTKDREEQDRPTLEFPLFFDPAPPVIGEDIRPVNAGVQPSNHDGFGARQPLSAVRAIVIETSSDEAGERVIPLSRARAALRLMQHSANFHQRGSERPPLIRDLLASTASCYEVCRPPQPTDSSRVIDLAVTHVVQSLR